MTTDTYEIKFLEAGNLRGWYLIIRTGIVLDPHMGRAVSSKYKISRPDNWQEINGILSFFGLQELATA